MKTWSFSAVQPQTARGLYCFGSEGILSLPDATDHSNDYAKDILWILGRTFLSMQKSTEFRSSPLDRLEFLDH